MRLSRQSGVRFGRGLGCLAACAGLMLQAPVLCASHTEASAWDNAVIARQVFEAEPQGTHTKLEYARVMNEFRAIYHGNPSDAHAGRAVQQVAELLAEEGRELSDRKALRDAAGQYEFMAKAYPGGSMAPRALGQAVELLGPDAADDATEARRVRALIASEYPRSAEARELEKRTENREQRSDDVVVMPSAVGPSSGEHYRRSAAKVDDVPVVAADAKAEPGAEVDEHSLGVSVDAQDAKPRKMATVTGIRHWSTPTYTRVAIDLGDAVEYQAARVEHPDRIFFDLHHARLAQQLVGKSFAVTDDGFLTRIRAAQFSGDVTRVVLDVHQVGEYSAFLLPNPYRLIIDIHGTQNETLQDAASDQANGSAPPAHVAEGSQGPAATADAPAGGTTEVSSLPPMPVTDGSSGFGLPSRSEVAAKDAKQGVATPRVIIP
ncbi:MAG TPA: AMIN domain-containing protein, partial [Acidobacteriaceae bacterium]